jgi:hypothetical protein
MNTKNILVTTALLIGAFAFTSCEKEEQKKPETPAPAPNPQEVITTVKLVLTDTLGNAVTGTWKDADGDGPGTPVITGVTLKSGMLYSGMVLLLDESKSPVDTISNEVKEEAETHQFFYTPEGGVSSRLEIVREDKDKNNQPVGILTQVNVTAGAAVNGSLKVVLKHYDGINKSTDPNVGETDVEAIFPVTLN